MAFLLQQVPSFQASITIIMCLSRLSLFDRRAKEAVPTCLAKDRVSTGPRWQMRRPVFIHFSWLNLPFFLIVLSTNCLWLCWQGDWIKFEDPRKSSLGKWHLRKRWETSWMCWAWLQNLLCQWSLATISGDVGEVEVIIAEPLFSEAWLESSGRTQWGVTFK